jgi:hypothetical protein
MVWQVKQTIGIKLERTNDWGVVLQKNPGTDLPIIGSVLTRINNESVLLKPHRELENLLKTASWPLELQFRRPPVKKGVLIKQSRAVKGYKNWKKRFFVLESGNLSYYDKEGGKIKGTFSLRNLKGSQCMVTLAPRKLLSGNEVGVMIVKGDDLLVLKGETPEEMMEWAAVIYYAVSLHNGGNPDIFELEARRLERIAQDDEKKRQSEEALTLQALAAEEERSRRLKEEAEQAMEDLQQKEKERLEQVEKEAAEKISEEERLKSEQEEKVAALAHEQKEEETRKEVEALKASLELLQKEKEAAEKAAEDALKYKAEQEAILKQQLEEAQLSVEAANKKLEEGETKTVEAAVDGAKKAAKRRTSVAMATARDNLTDQDEQDLADKAAELIISTSEGSSGEGDDSDDEDFVPKPLPGSTFHLDAPSGLLALGLDRSRQDIAYAPKYVKEDTAWML